MNYFTQPMKNAFNFSGRARRKEYWMFALFTAIISIVLMIIETLIGLEFTEGVGVLSTLFSLVILIPSLSLLFRRLHDTGRSAAWILIALIPVIGGIVLFVFTVLDSQPQTNKWGPNPKGTSQEYSYNV